MKKACHCKLVECDSLQNLLLWLIWEAFFFLFLLSTVVNLNAFLSSETFPHSAFNSTSQLAFHFRRASSPLLSCSHDAEGNVSLMRENKRWMGGSGVALDTLFWGGIWASPRPTFPLSRTSPPCCGGWSPASRPRRRCSRPPRPPRPCCGECWATLAGSTGWSWGCSSRGRWTPCWCCRWPGATGSCLQPGFASGWIQVEEEDGD